MSLPKYQSAKRVSVYLSMPDGEIQTKAIIQDAFMHDKEVFVPYTHRSPTPPPTSVMDMVQLHSLEDYAALQADAWGIPTPAKDSIPGRQLAIPSVVSEDQTQIGGLGGLDFVVVPGMAFDKTLGRLGHGKGFYDYFFERCKAHADANGREMPVLGTLLGTASTCTCLVCKLTLRQSGLLSKSSY